MTFHDAAAGDNDALDQFFAPNHQARRGRGFSIFLIVVASLLVLAAILAVVLEFAARSYAESRAEKQIDSSLPAGTKGTVSVSIHGFSVILQALSGRLEHVTLTSHNLTVDKLPIAFTADLTEVPLTSGAVTGPATATVRIDQAVVNKSAFLASAGGSIALGKGTLSYDGTATILGLPIDYTLTSVPTASADGRSLVLTPSAVSVGTSGSRFSSDAVLDFLKARPVTVCAAKSLPSSVRLWKVSAEPGQLILDLRSTGLPLSGSGLSATGSCS